MKSIGIVIPAYNEKDNILNLVKGIRKKLSCIIVIIDDSSNIDIKKILQVIIISSISMIIWELGHPYILGNHTDHHTHHCD